MTEETVTLTMAQLEALLRRKDAMCIWLNLDHRISRVVRVLGDNNRLDTRDDPELTVELEERGSIVRTARVRVSEIFELLPNVRKIVHWAAGEGAPVEGVTVDTAARHPGLRHGD